MKKILVINIIGILLLLSIIPAGYATIINNNQSNQSQNLNKSEFYNNEYYDQYSIMSYNSEMIKELKYDYFKAQKAYIDPNLNNEILTTTSFSILDLLNYIPEEHDQRRCSNCWAWPATDILAIALNVQEDIFNRLSVQYINSCGEIVGVGCCEGGSLGVFINFYRRTDMAIPWSNENAHFQDQFAQCNTPCDSISTMPNYPISSIYRLTIETHEIPEEEAIVNIKNILHQQKGVYFSWFLPDMEYRQDFSGFWSDESESEVYNLDWTCGREFNEDEGGGHAVLCVGYNDEEGDENDYWIMLNSWGAPDLRPNGLFRVNMHMDYDCTVLFDGREYFSFDFETMNVTYGSEEGAPNPPQIEGPTSGSPETVYSYQFSTIDPQNDDVFFMVDWGDDTAEGWIGPISSGEQIELNHSWQQRGDYTISAKAKDINDDESLWAILPISMPKKKTINDIPRIVLWLVEHFPFTYNVLF